MKELIISALTTFGVVLLAVAWIFTRLKPSYGSYVQF